MKYYFLRDRVEKTMKKFSGTSRFFDAGSGHGFFGAFLADFHDGTLFIYLRVAFSD